MGRRFQPSSTTSFPRAWEGEGVCQWRIDGVTGVVAKWKENLTDSSDTTARANATGLLTHLLGFSKDRLGSDPKQGGRLMENFVVMELRKQASWRKTKPELFHFRTQAGREVDIVLEDRSGRIVGIEVKAGATLGTDDLKGLKALAELAGKQFHRGIVLYTGQDMLPFGSRIHALPVSALWLRSSR